MGSLREANPNALTNAIGYAKVFSRSHGALIRVFHESGTLPGLDPGRGR